MSALTGMRIRGSSPLARGLLNRREPLNHGHGIIPARAGFTATGLSGAPSTWDHPRSRGVYDHQMSFYGTGIGSSPLARGLRGRRRHSGSPSRIIPARAGFTPWSTTVSPTTWDHPRSRGVYSNFDGMCLPDWGSSPLARGLQDLPGHVRPALGIIPARAGFTTTRCRSTAPASDHPRSRGVYGVDGDIPGHRRGSSPLARGLRPGQQQCRQRPGIIPARAGFTRTSTACACLTGDHPRSRGVYEQQTVEPGEVTGSSPLARGLRHRG